MAKKANKNLSLWGWSCLVVCSTHCVVIVWQWFRCSRSSPSIIFLFRCCCCCCRLLLFVATLCLRLPACLPAIHSADSISLGLAINFIIIIHFHTQIYTCRALHHFFPSLRFSFFLVDVADLAMLLFLFANIMLGQMPQHSSNQTMRYYVLLYSVNDVRELPFL